MSQIRGIASYLFILNRFLSFSALAAEPESRSPASVIFAPIQETHIDKSHDNLFHKTPKEFMRSFNSDNGGITNGPYTLDAGHFQVESELVNFSVLNDDQLNTEERILVLNNLIFK